MDIKRALPSNKYAKALKHSRSREFQNKLQVSINRIRTWSQAPGVAQTRYLYFGYGKDSMAAAIVMKKAGVDFTALCIDNQGDFPGHELVVPEFQAFFGGMDQLVLDTNQRFIDIIAYWLDWAKFYYGDTYKGKPLNFFNWGPVTEQIAWEAVEQFEEYTETGEPGILRVWGNRAAEGMERYYEAQNKGLFYLVGEEGDPFSYWRALPISDWRDVDVWALLISEDCPVSDVYSKHDLPMAGGKKAFPRTVFWCAPEIWNPKYYKWLAHYYPALLKEAITRFPEIEARFTKA